jgi:hypothetical protein
MPDFERHTDSLREFMAQERGDAYDKGYVSGYIKGKDIARWQVAKITLLVAVVTIIFARFS